ncbi:MAG TPA: TlyA family RNA methyltransferase [Acidobacteriaceae bacterium]|jgi:23S rRNA (cytidine1920-2'-O)/16S rRNA (cytidine1409-2'-O)-methyltransferase
MKARLDKFLVERGLVPSRERAQALILAGRVLVNEQKVEKPGAAVAEDAAVRLLGDDLRYVSRGGLKLEAALAHWQIDLGGRVCADVGASTGGFSDCMLQHGAARVVAIDTGYGQIAHKLRVDPRVRLLERTNARNLTREDLQAEQATVPVTFAAMPITFLAMDVSFISATLVLPSVARAMPELTEMVVLVKPQFEAGREHVGKGGIVRDPEAHRLAVDRVRAAVAELGGEGIEVMDSPILGAEGNREFLLHARFAMTHRNRPLLPLD